MQLNNTQSDQTECTDQKSRGVVEQAAEAAHKVPLQEGGVLWGELVGTVGHWFTATQEHWSAGGTEKTIKQHG